MSDPVPCPECRKPIQPQAANCWFCGAVFDTTPCPRCDSAVKSSSFTCWFCGDPMPIVPKARAIGSPNGPTLSENIQSSPILREEQSSPPPAECAHCGEKLAPPYRHCPGCGRPPQRVNYRRVHWEERPIVRPHRGGALLTFAIIGLFGCGVILGLIVTFRAVLDLGEMREGRMDKAGKGMTIAALVIGLFAAATNVLMLYLGVRRV